jgi:hypothetical protein
MESTIKPKTQQVCPDIINGMMLNWLSLERKPDAVIQTLSNMVVHYFHIKTCTVIYLKSNWSEI